MAIINLGKSEQIKLLEEKSLDEIKEVYRPLAESVAGHYIGELVEIALETIGRARSKYLEKREGGSYRFDTYLTWWFKTAIEAEMGLKNKDTEAYLSHNR